MKRVGDLEKGNDHTLEIESKLLKEVFVEITGASREKIINK